MSKKEVRQAAAELTERLCQKADFLPGGLRDL